jgi:hypothetical protein
MERQEAISLRDALKVMDQKEQEKRKSRGLFEIQILLPTTGSEHTSRKVLMLGARVLQPNQPPRQPFQTGRPAEDGAVGREL